MKQSYILVLIVGAIISIASANGVAEEQNKDRTGSPDGSNTCVQCHMGGNFDPTVSITLENSMSQEVNTIHPGETYEMRVSVNNFFPFPDVYGFQATALMADLSNAGSFSDPASNVQIQAVDNEFITDRHVVEHSSPSFIGEFTVDWTAPLEGDSVYFYAAGITGNGNDEPEGDNGHNTAIVLPLLDPDGIAEEGILGIELKHTPENIWISHPHLERLDELIIHSIDGRQIMRKETLGLPFALSKHEMNSSILLITIRANGKLTTLKTTSL